MTAAAAIIIATAVIALVQYLALASLLRNQHRSNHNAIAANALRRCINNRN